MSNGAAIYGVPEPTIISGLDAKDIYHCASDNYAFTYRRSVGFQTIR